MFNLYSNTTSPDSFLGLVAKKQDPYAEKFENDSRRVVTHTMAQVQAVTGFAVASLLVISLIANGSQAQSNFEMQTPTASSSYSNVI